MPSCFSCLAPRRNPTDETVGELPDESKILRPPYPPLPPLPSTASLGPYILNKLSALPDHVGQVDATTGREDTFAAMKDRSMRTALWLRSRGVGSGDVVVICSDNHCDTAMPVFAAMYCAATVVAWDPIMNTKDLKHLISIATPKVVFCNEKSACTVHVSLREQQCDAEIVVFGEHSGCTSYRDVLGPHPPDAVRNFKCDEFDNAEQVAVVVFSSGSTGLPKGVEHTHRTLLSQLAFTVILNMDRKTCSVFSSIYWISGLIGIFVSIACSMKKIIVPVFDEEICCSIVEKYKVNWCLMGTSILLRLIYSGCLEKFDMSSLEKITAGGGVIGAEAFNKLKVALPTTLVMLGYGMTELGGAATIQGIDAKPGSCGKPVPSVACKIVEIGTGKVLGPNGVGELCWQSPCMMKGYRNNPEETAATIDSEGWLHSGDTGYYDNEGNIFVIDRIKQMIKYRGNQIAPAELEAIVIKHPGVHECVVVGKPHKVDVEHPVAFVVRKPNSNVTEREIVDLVATEVIERKQLRGGVRFLDALPVTPNGKPKRAVLKDILRNEVPQ